MLGSDYRELIVPKRDNQNKKIAILAGGAALTIASIIFAMVSGQFLLLIISLLIGFGTWYLWIQNRIEYEYVISGDELTITKILAESKRKPMLTVSILKFTEFGNLCGASPVHADQTLVLACAEQDANAYYADFDHEDYGKTRLLITPNDDILAYLAKKLPRNLGFRWEPSRKNVTDENG